MKNTKTEDVIYLDEESYNKLLKSIKKLEHEYNQNEMRIKHAYDESNGNEMDYAEFQDINRASTIILNQLKVKKEELLKAKIIHKNSNNNKVGIGDIVRLNVFCSKDEIKEKILKLVGGTPDYDMNSEIQEVSISSPIGQAIYEKEIGEESSYTVNKKEFKVIIKEKIKNQKILVKKLNK